MNSPVERINLGDIPGLAGMPQSVKDALERAREQLAGQPDVGEALRKLVPALTEKMIKVFFSYKKPDERAAQIIIDILREATGGKLDIAHMGDFSKIAGTEWRQKIRASVRSANWFILLLPNPSDELDWCLHETGLFEAQHTSADRLICFHHPDTAIPGPLDIYQAVAATKPDMEKFLSMVLVEENPVAGMLPINKFAGGSIPVLAQRINDAIRAPMKKLSRKVFLPSITLRLDGLGKLETSAALDAAEIMAANDAGLKVFGYDEFEGNFGKLCSEVLKINSDARWREELYRVVGRIVAGFSFEPVQAVMHAPNGKVYRPVAYAAERAGEKGPVQTCVLTFAEDVVSPDLDRMPAELANLVTTLRFTFRFRWEVLERFGRVPLSDSDIERLEVSLTRIIVDWGSCGAQFKDGVQALFQGAQAVRVTEMNQHWERLYKPDKTGELDMAIFQKNGDRIRTLLGELLPMNQEFLEMAADRFSQMIAQPRFRRDG